MQTEVLETAQTLDVGQAAMDFAAQVAAPRRGKRRAFLLRLDCRAFCFTYERKVTFQCTPSPAQSPFTTYSAGQA